MVFVLTKFNHRPALLDLISLSVHIIPCEDTGKKTWRFLIRIDDVIDYLVNRNNNLLEIAAPQDMFSSKAPKADTSPIDLTELQNYILRLWRNESDILTVEDVSRLSGFSKDAIYSWLKRGKLMSIRYMGRHLISKEELAKTMFRYR